MTITTSGVPYSQRRREAFVQGLPRTAMTLTDTYIGGATALAQAGITSFGAGVFAPSLPTLQLFCGGLAAAHGIYALRQAWVSASTEDKVESRRASATAIGEFLTAAGFVGLAAGYGPVAAPLVLLGNVTTNFARMA